MALATIAAAMAIVGIKQAHMATKREAKAVRSIIVLSDIMVFSFYLNLSISLQLWYKQILAPPVPDGRRCYVHPQPHCPS